MNSNRSSRESGQAIFVIALIMVALIGALGLAIDGGGLAFMYRDAQNAADAAALAAAYARCTGGDVTAAALTSAEDNGFANGGGTTITVQSPPTAGPQAGNSNFVSVSVQATKQAYFIHLLYPQGLQATAAAVAQCTPGTTGGAGVGFAMYGLGATGGIGATCHSGCQKVEGNALRIEGNVVSVGEPVDWASGVSFTSGSASMVTTPVNPLAHLSTTQFDTGGSVWNRAASHTRHPSGWTISVNAGNLASVGGLHYVVGNVDIDANGFTLPAFTVVATGTINIDEFTTGLHAYIDDVLAYSIRDLGSSVCDSNRVINIDGAGDSRGIVYAPNGQVEVLYTGGTWVGSLVGRYVDWWGKDGSAVTTLRALPAAVPPMVGLAS